MVVESTALIYLLSWNSRWSSETHLASRFQAMWRSLTRHQRRKTPVEFEEIRKKKTRCKFYLSATLEHQRYLFPKKCYMERLRCWQLRLKTKGDERRCVLLRSCGSSWHWCTRMCPENRAKTPASLSHPQSVVESPIVTPFSLSLPMRPMTSFASFDCRWSTGILS